MKQRYLRLDDTIEFGKHKGADVEDLIDDDPGWLAWAYENDVVEFDSEVISIMEKKKII